MLVFYQDFENVYRIPLCKSNGNATLMPFTFQYLFSFYIYGCSWKTLQVQHTISRLPLSGKFLLTWIIIPGLSAVSTMEFDSSVSLPNLKHTKKKKEKAFCLLLSKLLHECSTMTLWLFPWKNMRFGYAAQCFFDLLSSQMEPFS